MRPRLRVPMWVAVTAVAATYALRSILRGWDFRPDIPADAVVLGILVALVLLRLAVARSVDSEGADEERQPEAADGDAGDDSGASATG